MYIESLIKSIVLFTFYSVILTYNNDKYIYYDNDNKTITLLIIKHVFRIFVQTERDFYLDYSGSTISREQSKIVYFLRQD